MPKEKAVRMKEIPSDVTLMVNMLQATYGTQPILEAVAKRVNEIAERVAIDHPQYAEWQKAANVLDKALDDLCQVVNEAPWLEEELST